jgi:hypothetical protein
MEERRGYLHDSNASVPSTSTALELYEKMLTLHTRAATLRGNSLHTPKSISIQQRSRRTSFASGCEASPLTNLLRRLTAWEFTYCRRDRMLYEPCSNSTLPTRMWNAPASWSAKPWRFWNGNLKKPAQPVAPRF